MKCCKVHIVFLGAALTALATISLNPGTSRGQSAAGREGQAGAESHVKPTALMVDKRPGVLAEKTSTGSTFAFAATQNALLSGELSWTFGGKEQRGWSLYVPLINELIGNVQSPSSDNFASMLAHWQQTVGLTATGMLDEESLYKMISEWQDRRIKNRDYPLPGQLVTAPAADFYYPERPEELRQIEAETYDAYRRMIAAAVADPSLGLAHGADGSLAPTEKYLKIMSAYRTREYQEQLRRQSPNAGRAGLAVNSPHFTGRALDLYVGGEPVETKDSNRAIQVQTPVYRWLIHNADRFGFRPYFYEPWHWEYVKKSD